ncbi:MAG TPA: TlpA disulfide reductase family protein [Lysobacter sp.]|nr:TlpA disulfide reductase family protein [Lysobacter sp.]
MLSLGPFPLPAVLLAFAVVVALLVARQFRPRRSAVATTIPPSPAPVPEVKAGAVLVDMLFIGVVVARVAFVAQWLPEYLADPWSIVRIGDGGFTVWAGLLAGLGWGAWKVRRIPALRMPVSVGAMAGLAVWGGLAGALWLMQQSSVSLPTMDLTTVDGETVQLSAMSDRPMVLNLWATWCPPCRREMPVLSAAQQRHEGVNFVFVNQGEGPDLIRDYLGGEGLTLANVLLDPFSSVMQGVGSRGLPTTLFFDGNGKLVDTHMGELSEASLTRKLQALGSSPASTPTLSPEVP